MTDGADDPEDQEDPVICEKCGRRESESDDCDCEYDDFGGGSDSE